MCNLEMNKQTVHLETCLTCMALAFLREARLWAASFCTAAKARENRSRPTSFFNNSINSWARFFSVGSETRPKDRFSHVDNATISI